MAGGKETPRQKMIGMMYLVLTALLALQVSNAVLEKFAIINETLTNLIKEGDKKSETILSSIVKDAGENQAASVVTAKQNAQKVRELTKSTIASIEALKLKMMALSNTKEVNDALINDHSSKVATMMMDAKNPEGKNYEKLLNDYVIQVNALSNIQPPLPKIAKAPKDIPFFASDKDHVRKSFIVFTFENTPVIAALASVTQHETEILEYESRVLGKLAEDAGAQTIKLDKFIPMVRAKSSTVAAGAKYEAEMFLTGSSSALSSEFFKDGAKLPIVEDKSGVKMGKVEFTAQGGGYDKLGIAKKSFKAKITVKGQDFEDLIEYYVAQPIIRVTTGNAPTLYMNCGNTVNIEVPALGSNYNPSFAATSAEIIKGAKPGMVTIIPKQRKISVSVSNAGTKLGDQPFDVKNIPEPKYIAYIGTTPVDLRTGIKANQLGNLTIKAVPEENFKQEVPKDARYRIKKADIALGRGTASVQSLRGTNENPDLRAWIGQARPGDKIVVEIKEVSRRNFKDDEEKVDIKGSSGIIFIQIN
ncbi:MAG: gliding motility protein GldM [Chryseolinea sp.]